jgi:hypothetical protein
MSFILSKLVDDKWSISAPVELCGVRCGVQTYLQAFWAL